MLKRLLIPMRIVLLTMLAACASWAQNHYIVRLWSGDIHSVANAAGMQVVASLGGSAKGLYVLNSQLPASSAAPLLRGNPAVVSVEVDASLALPETVNTAVTAAPNVAGVASWIGPYINRFQTDPATGAKVWSAYLNQPAVSDVHLNAARSIATGKGTVAILDTGIDFTHPAFGGSVVWGWDFVNNLPGGYATPFDLPFNSNLSQSSASILDLNTSPILDDDSTLAVNQSTTPILDDDSSLVLGQSTTPILDGLSGAKPSSRFGHGTMVAGVVHLFAPTAHLLPVKVFDANGGSSLSLIIQGIYYAVDQGAKVINMSFSLTQGSTELQTAINYATAHNAVIVAAAGNEGESIMVYPAGYSGVEGVGSTNNQDVRSVFSNYGQVVDIAAPGEGVITPYPLNNWAAGWGTSFSAPMVAGTAALLFQLNPQLNQSAAVQALSHAAPIGQQLGVGRLDVYQAVTHASGR
jgi:subtilisin family serine protease